MRLLAVLTLAAGLLFGSAVQADDKPEDKAKAAAAAFMKALKSKDVDAALKESDVPFVCPGLAPGAPPKLDKLEKLEALAPLLKLLIETQKDWDVPIAVGKVEPLADMPPGRSKDPEVKQVFDVAGADGFVVFLNNEKKEEVLLLVRIKDGFAKVVGLLPVGGAAAKER